MVALRRAVLVDGAVASNVGERAQTARHRGCSGRGGTGRGPSDAHGL